MSAAAELTATQRAGIVPLGIPVRSGRLYLGRLRELLPAHDPVEVVAGFETACWLGSVVGRVPDLGRLAYRGRTMVDRRGRVTLDRRVRVWLGTEDATSFEVVAVSAPEGGILVVPVEDFARRWEVISR